MATQTYTDGVTLSSAAEFNKYDTASYPVLTGVSGTNTVLATGPANYTLSAAMPPMVLIPAVTNTGATTLTLTPSGGAALTIKNIFSGGVACVGGELVAGHPALIEYDGTQYNIVSGPAVTRGSTSTTFTFDGTGGTSAAFTLTWQKIGRLVTLNFPASVVATTGTSSSTLTSNTAIAAAARPAVLQAFPVWGMVNNAVTLTIPGVVLINTNGTMTIERDAAGTAFTNSATAGTVGAGFSVTYFTG